MWGQNHSQVAFESTISLGTTEISAFSVPRLIFLQAAEFSGE